MAIDWKFIGTLEGAGILTGYVPVANTSQSGVTIATGVDLGQATPQEIDGWAVDESLKVKLKPYCGLKKQAAVQYLAVHPLTITREECEQIDAVVEADYAMRVAAVYDAKSAVPFAQLPDRAQTAIVSVAFQYGTNLAKACPSFWKFSLAQDWARVVKELENFGDAYSQRRIKEANYLRPVLTLGAKPQHVNV